MGILVGFAIMSSSSFNEMIGEKQSNFYHHYQVSSREGSFLRENATVATSVSKHNGHTLRRFNHSFKQVVWNVCSQFGNTPTLLPISIALKQIIHPSPFLRWLLELSVLTISSSSVVFVLDNMTTSASYGVTRPRLSASSGGGGGDNGGGGPR